jgi:hypothetical protein
VLVRELVAFADRNLKVAWFEDPTLAGRQTLLRRSRKDATLSPSHRCAERNENDDEGAREYPCEDPGIDMDREDTPTSGAMFLHAFDLSNLGQLAGRTQDVLMREETNVGEPVASRVPLDAYLCRAPLLTVTSGSGSRHPEFD